MAKLLRRLGTRDAALIVMGGIIGSGIFRNPSVVAKLVHTGPLVMLAWALGGIIALLGAFLFAELAARRPEDGGLYAYMRDAFHPSIAFAYGWTLLLVSQSGGAAAAAQTFAGYFAALSGFSVNKNLLAAITVSIFVGINCIGVKAGSRTQNTFMIAKILAIVGFIGVGLFAPLHASAVSLANAAPPANALAAMGLALVPVMFAYTGWQTSSFMTGELRDPQRTLPRGMIIGVSSVIALYLAVNAVCLWVLGPSGLGATATPASDIARAVLGPIGERAMAIVVALSTLGFLGNQILTSPRVYFQMAADGVFFKQLAWIHPKTRVPVVAIVIQGIAALLIALLPNYEQILNYVTSVDYVFFGLAAIALIVFRFRDARSGHNPAGFKMPLHPYSTILFGLVAWAIVADVAVKSPTDTLAGLGILLSALPVYWIFTRFRRQPETNK